MKLLVLILLLSSTTFAKNTNNSVTNNDEQQEHLNVEELKKRLVVKSGIYVFSPNGEKLLYEDNQSSEWRIGKGGDIGSTSSHTTKDLGIFTIKHNWTVGSDGRLNISMKQLESNMEGRKAGPPKLGKVIREKNFILKDFKPIDWVLIQNDKLKAIYRLTPSLTKKERFHDIDLPIGMTNAIVTDNKGYVWTHGLNYTGKYVSITTHKGTIYMSYTKFKGAKEIGSAQGHEITVNISKKHKVKILSTSSILPRTVSSKVYGIIDLKKRSKSMWSTHLQSSSDEEHFITATK